MLSATMGRFFSVRGSAFMGMNALMISLYLFALVLCANAANPDFMDKSIGIADSIVRAHLYAMFKITTLNLNPLYLTAALYPFWLVYMLISFFWKNAKGTKQGGPMAARKIDRAVYALLACALIALVCLFAFATKTVDSKMLDQLLATKEVKAFYSGSTPALLGLGSPAPQSN